MDEQSGADKKRLTRHAVARGMFAARATSLYEAAESEVFMLPVRLRKLIGMLLLIALVVIYALVASAVAVTQLAESSAWVHLAFFAVSGVVWVLPAMLIIWWMARPGKKQPET